MKSKQNIIFQRGFFFNKMRGRQGKLEFEFCWEKTKVVFISKNILEFHMNQLFKIFFIFKKTIENVYYTPTVSRWWEPNWTYSDTSQSPGTGSPRRQPESRPARCCTAGSGESSDGCSQPRGAAFYRRDSELRRCRQTPCWRFDRH